MIKIWKKTVRAFLKRCLKTFLANLYLLLSQKFIRTFPVFRLLFICSILLTGLFSTICGAEISLTIEEKAWLKAHPDIQLGASTSYPPLIINNVRGPHTGMLIDLFEAISQRLNTNIQLHIEDSWPSVLEKAKNRTIDGLASGGRSASREEHLNSTDTLFSTYYYVFSRTNDQLLLKSVKDLEGMRIGYKKADTPVKSLLDKYAGVTSVPYSDNVAMTKGLMNREVDVLVAWISYDFWRRDNLQGAVDNILLATDTPLNMYTHIRKDWPELIPILNKALASIRHKELPEIMDKWFIERPRLPVIPKFMLAKEERDWLEKKQSVRVRVTDFPPYIIPNEDGEPSGMAIDYLKLISERTGVTFEYYSSGKTFSQALNSIINHQGPDLFSVIVQTPEREKSIIFTNDYLNSPYMIFTRADNKQIIVHIDDLRGKKTALLRGAALHEMMERHYPDFSLMLYDNDIEAIEAVASGEADAYIGNMMLTSYLLLNRGPYNLKITAPSPFDDQHFSMGIRNDWPELASIIDKGLAAITAQEQDEIRNRYISVRYDQHDTALIWKWVLIVIASASGVILLFFFWNKSLKNQVATRTSELETSEEQYSSTLNALVAGVVVHSSDTSILFSNPEATKLLGVTQDQIIGKEAVSQTWDFLHEDFSVMQVEDYPVNMVLSTKKPIHDSVIGIKRPDRKDITWVIASAIPLFSNNGELEKVIVNFINYTDRKQAAENERASKAFLNKILNNIGDPVFVKDDQHRLIIVNDAFCTIFGVPRELAIGKTLAENVSPDERDHFFKIDRQVLEDGQENTCEETLTLKNSETLTLLTKKTRYVDGNGDKFLVGVIRDITERKQAEEEKLNLENRLQQSQKMESIGTLAGGIAHDFNNILSAILGYAELARDDCQPGTTILEDLNEVLEAGNRAKSLVHQILAFSRQDDMERIILQPASIVNETITMLRPSLPTTIEITQDIDAVTGLVFVDPTQLNQILMNLCTNAFHAMEDTGGKLDISLKEISLSNEDLVHQPDVTAGTFIQLSISDSGTGIAPTIKDKIFHPYFTTKETGKGTGMGLSMVHGIVKNYGGFISLYSELGEGTVFHVFLPTVEKEVLTTNEINNQIPIGRERILFVDDEEILSKMGKTMLERLGYHVTARNSSFEALETFQNQPDDFDIVITDQTMPGMTGSDISRRMLQIRPDIPIILCTGYSTIISEEKAKSMGIKEFALKPLAKKDMAKLIRKVLDVA